MQTSQLFGNIRTMIGHPGGGKVRTSDLIIFIQQVVGLLQGKMKNTDQRWFPAVGEISPPLQQTTFKVNLPNYSKALSVEWINPRNPNSSGIEIDVLDWSRMDDRFLDSPYEASETGVFGNSLDPIDLIQAISFQGFGGSLEARVTPVVRQQHKYKVWYEKYVPPISAQEDQIELPDEYWYLTAARAAKLALPLCEYEETKAAGYRSAINDFIREADKNFEEWILKNKKVTSHRIERYRLL